MTKTELRAKVSQKIESAVSAKSVTNLIIAEIVNDILDIVELDPYKSCKIIAKWTETGFGIGTPFIIGNTYVLTQQAGNNFSNIGYVTNGVPFVATGTTPTSWTVDQGVTMYTFLIDTFVNNISGLVFSVNGVGRSIRVTSPTPIFQLNTYFATGANIYYNDDYSIDIDIRNQGYKSIEFIIKN